jgi:tetratricopeptide (TPR) repeat protein
MVFDKTKAMRNAERYLAQGKIHAAIVEYKQVVAHDPKDFGTLNMLGDLYTKSLEKKQAIGCYTSVAEHYSKQGFAQKAIAVYNKIAKIQPNSIEISAKLADLYRFKGSVNEARTHYKLVAEHHESHGRKLEALEIQKQIASLDPNDTTIYLDLAAAYLKENQPDEAAAAFTEAALRLSKKSKHVDAIAALEKALEIDPNEPAILAAYVQSHFACGTAMAAAVRLAEILEAKPHDGEVLQLLIDCHLESGNTADAEKEVIRLVEKDPASYPKFLDLAHIYLKKSDAESAARVMTMSSEHLLLAGQADEFQTLLTEILTLDPEQLEGLRLRARLSAWQRDEAGMHESLIQLASVAKRKESIDDERFALSQLVMIAPQEIEYVGRLKQINDQYGFDDAYSAGNLFDDHFLKGPRPTAQPELETFTAVSTDSEPGDDESDDVSADFAIIDGSVELSEVTVSHTAAETDEERLLREVDSIKFYIDSGYLELAGKAIAELRAEYGERSEISDLETHLDTRQSAPHPDVEMPAPVVQSSNGNAYDSRGFGIADLRSELGLNEAESDDDSDYDTHYHTAVAYQEMGLLDEAIKEFQEAVTLVRPNDPTRRFFHCANLLGHCFMQKAMPNLALTWYQRALETPALVDEEKLGIWYELAAAYEADGDLENAGRYFEQVYAENINFRDVSARVRNMTVSK